MQKSCHYCSEPASSIDHVVPRQFGGTDEESNLVPACKSCNSAKGTLPVEVFGLNSRERTQWLKDRGWNRLGPNTWRHPEEGTSAFFTKAAAMRHAAFVHGQVLA